MRDLKILLEHPHDQLGITYRSSEQHFRDFCINNGLTQLVKSPTRPCSSGGNILDLVLTNTPDRISNRTVFPGISDNHTVTYTFTSADEVHPRQQRSFLIYRKAHIDAIRSLIRSFSGFFSSAPNITVEEDWNSLKQAFGEPILFSPNDS